MAKETSFPLDQCELRGATMSSMRFALQYREPFDWKSLLLFLRARSIAGVEDVGDDWYRRVVRVGQEVGWVEVTPGPRLRVMISDSLRVVAPQVRKLITHLMDLDCDPLQVSRVLGTLSAPRPGLRLPGAVDGFEIAIRAIVGQQVSVAAARTLMGRFVAALGSSVETPFPELRFAFPTATHVASASAEKIRTLGILPSRAKTIVGLATSVAEGRLRLEHGVDVEEKLAGLGSLDGIGDWTGQYIAMRALGWRDGFPHSDLILRKALGLEKAREVLAAGEAWRPFRGYAVMHLWKGYVDA